MLSKSTIYIYRGHGASKRGCFMLNEAFTRSVDSAVHSVQSLTSEEVIEGAWMKHAALLVIGGGADLGFISSLGDHGTNNIRCFVEGGGNYLGVCAGGYFASSYVAFDEAGPLEVMGERALKFFPGSCVGPVFKGFNYDTEEGSCAADIVVKTGATETLKTNVYFNGGGSFHHDPTCNNAPTYEILARFSSLLDNPAAIVKCRVGRGQAILTSVHPEYLTEHLDKKDTYLHEVITKLEETADSRNKLWCYLLTMLGITCI